MATSETYVDVVLGDVELVRELLVELRDVEDDVVSVGEGVPAAIELEETTTGHDSTLTTFVSKVTLPLNPNAPPFETAAVFSVTEADARMLP